MVMICVSLYLLFRIWPPGVILARKPLLFNGPVFGEGYRSIPRADPYSRSTLASLMDAQRIDGIYKHYNKGDLKGYLRDFLKKKKDKFFLINIPDTIAEELERRLDEKPVRVQKVRSSNPRSSQ